MNEYLTTPQHGYYIGYWVSDGGGGGGNVNERLSTLGIMSTNTIDITEKLL